MFPTRDPVGYGRERPLDIGWTVVEGREMAAERQGRGGVEVRSFLRIIVRNRRLIGPGRANLLESIDRTGSIAAAAREMRMSHRRAWLHVDDLARQIGSPVVETAQGGSPGGGAILSETRRALLHVYRRMERRTERELAADLDRLRRLVKPGRPARGCPA